MATEYVIPLRLTTIVLKIARMGHAPLVVPVKLVAVMAVVVHVVHVRVALTVSTEHATVFPVVMTEIVVQTGVVEPAGLVKKDSFARRVFVFVLPPVKADNVDQMDVVDIVDFVILGFPFVTTMAFVPQSVSPTAMGDNAETTDAELLVVLAQILISVTILGSV